MNTNELHRNNENQESLRIPCEHHDNYENHIIIFEIYENNENHQNSKREL